MKRALTRVALLLVTVVCLAGCGGSSARPTLTGGIRFFGRIPPGYTATGFQHGLVQILHGGKVVASAHLAQGQGYRFALSPGRYTIRTWGNARPGTYPPATEDVRIPIGRTVRANIDLVFH
jgi:hypothetical protein